MSHLNNHKGDNHTSVSEDLTSVSCVDVNGAETWVDKDMEDNKEKERQNKSSEGKEPGGNPSDKDEKMMPWEDKECHSPVAGRHQHSRNSKGGESEHGEQGLFKEQQVPTEGGQNEPSKNLPTQAGQRTLLADEGRGQCESRNSDSFKQVEQEPSQDGHYESSPHIESGELQPPGEAGQPSEIMTYELNEEQKSLEKVKDDPPKSGDSESSKGSHSAAGERKRSGRESESSEVAQKQASAEVVTKKTKRKKILTRICKFWSSLKAKLCCLYQPSGRDE